MAVLILNSCMDDAILEDRRTGRCLEDLLTQVGPIELGFRIQGLAAHLLMAQGLKIVGVYSQGHPDIVAVGDQGTMRFEIEANTSGVGSHQLTAADLGSLKPITPTDQGFFGVAICAHYPRWLIINQARLSARTGPAPLPVLEALSELDLSERWTRLFRQLITRHCEHLYAYSFELLSEWARSGRGLKF